MNRQLLYYSNGGAGNHGCEAIIRSLETVLKPSKKSMDLSIAIDEDKYYGLDGFIQLYDVNNRKYNLWQFAKSYIDLKLRKNAYALDLLPYKGVLNSLKNKKNLLAVSVGGDNYCYGGTDYYALLNKEVRKRGIPTVMVGCSIDPAVLFQSVIDDLKDHELIIARESITYKGLLDAGLTNVHLLPDPAFKLKTVKKDLPSNFVDGNTIGINLSPMVISYGKGNGILQLNAETLIDWILSQTDMNISFIPHVVWKTNDDREVMRPLYDKYKHTGRVSMIEDCTAEEVKGYISRCRFLVTARTHASIAAYSTCVPTLVIGYSIKARGIAQDIFGTSQNYVIPTQSISAKDDLLSAFKWLYTNEDSIKLHLEKFMPAYCNQLDLMKQILNV